MNKLIPQNFVDLEKLEINKQGNNIYRGFYPSERYFFDFKICTPNNGWHQWDTGQDASYFGVWVNPEKMETFTYCEGDTTLIVCNSKENFSEEIKSMVDFYGEQPPAAIGIDSDGKVTKYYDTRFIPE